MQVLRPRQFHPLPAVNTEALPTTLPAIEFLSPPLAEVPRVAVIVPAKVMPDATSPSPIPPPKPVIRASGFERADGPSVAPARTALPNLGSFESARTGETVPARGTIARSSGFSDGPAASSGTPRRNAVITAAFGDTTTERVAVASKQTAAARLTPVEILSKPRPAYTTEAREKHLEGEVLIEVHFTASGDARVVRVVRGLGSGLDETALAAARGIRFRPATRDGQPVDITALVHIVFQLAD
jgi:TonB family protein